MIFGFLLTARTTSNKFQIIPLPFLLYCRFYGRMSRTDAEQLLESEPMGTFLVRLSEKIWGYAISYKDVDRCKHYLINASTGQYKFLGANQLSHDSLSKLLLAAPTLNEF